MKAYNPSAAVAVHWLLTPSSKPPPPVLFDFGKIKAYSNYDRTVEGLSNIVSFIKIAAGGIFVPNVYRLAPHSPPGSLCTLVRIGAGYACR
jgi:hypothetical protein